MGTTLKAGSKAKAASTSGVRHGPSDKNTVTGGRPTAAPSMGAKAMAPLKGSNKGGIC